MLARESHRLMGEIGHALIDGAGGGRDWRAGTGWLWAVLGQA
jgi:hypothetical protein